MDALKQLHIDLLNKVYPLTPELSVQEQSKRVMKRATAPTAAMTVDAKRNGFRILTSLDFAKNQFSVLEQPALFEHTSLDDTLLKYREGLTRLATYNDMTPRATSTQAEQRIKMVHDVELHNLTLQLATAANDVGFEHDLEPLQHNLKTKQQQLSDFDRQYLIDKQTPNTINGENQVLASIIGYLHDVNPNGLEKSHHDAISAISDVESMKEAGIIAQNMLKKDSNMNQDDYKAWTDIERATLTKRQDRTPLSIALENALVQRVGELGDEHKAVLTQTRLIEDQEDLDVIADQHLNSASVKDNYKLWKAWSVIEDINSDLDLDNIATNEQLNERELAARDKALNRFESLYAEFSILQRNTLASDEKIYRHEAFERRDMVFGGEDDLNEHSITMLIQLDKLSGDSKLQLEPAFQDLVSKVSQSGTWSRTGDAFRLELTKPLLLDSVNPKERWNAWEQAEQAMVEQLDNASPEERRVLLGQYAESFNNMVADSFSRSAFLVSNPEQKQDFAQKAAVYAKSAQLIHDKATGVEHGDAPIVERKLGFFNKVLNR